MDENIEFQEFLAQHAEADDRRVTVRRYVDNFYAYFTDEGVAMSIIDDQVVREVARAQWAAGLRGEGSLTCSAVQRILINRGRFEGVWIDFSLHFFEGAPLSPSEIATLREAIPNAADLAGSKDLAEVLEALPLKDRQAVLPGLLELAKNPELKQQLEAAQDRLREVLTQMAVALIEEGWAFQPDERDHDEWLLKLLAMKHLKGLARGTSEHENAIIELLEESRDNPAWRRMVDRFFL